MTKRMRLATACVLASACTGCRRSPSFDVLGSYFPGWILCIVLGILLTVAVRVLIIRLRMERQIKGLPLLYMSLCLLFACTLWLLIFE